MPIGINSKALAKYSQALLTEDTRQSDISITDAIILK
jgi:hypothetical protein